jgi:rSAM/selenodomain-associated transferase 1
VKPVLILFGRVPRRGAVKRRLAAGIGADAAYGFYRRMFDSLPRRLFDRRWRIVLALTPLRADWRLPAGVDVWPQARGDLGARMRRALLRARGPALLIGTDIPDVSRGDIAEGFRALRRVPFVFGPAADGGYWLVGTRRRGLTSALFRNVRWSGSHALADSLCTLPASARAALLRRHHDVDDAEGWQRFRNRAARTRR